MTNIFNVFLITSLFFMLGLGCDALDGARQGSRPKLPKTESKEEISALNWTQVDALFNIKSEKTDAQKDKLWESFKGKRVEWEGEVTQMQAKADLIRYDLFIKMNKDTVGHDLMISLDASQKEKARALSTGDQIKFQGTLSSWGKTSAVTLVDGKIK